jgi:hypothetical protein
LAAGVVAQPSADSPALRAARERQEKLASVDFTFRIQETVEPGAMQRELLRGGQSPAKFPAEQLHLESVNRLIYDGVRMRHEDNHPMPDERTSRFEPVQALKLTDGRLVKSLLHPVGNVSRQASVALIATPRQESVADFALYMPFHLACRGHDNPGCRDAYTFQRLKPSGPGVAIGGVATEEYTLGAKSGATTYRCWVAPSQGYAVRRLRQDGANGKALYITDVQSAKEPISGQWLPTSWKHTMFNEQGGIRRTLEVTVTRTEVGGAYADNVFDLQFPPGVEVLDESAGRYFLVRDDGTYRPIAPGEDSPELTADLKSNWFSRNWWWLVSVAVATCGVLFLVIRRTRQANSPTPGLAPHSGVDPKSRGDS